MKKIILFIVFAFFFSKIINAQIADTLFYSVVKTGTISGHQKSWKNGSNEYQYLYYYNDRGRGDSTLSTIHTNNDGLIISLDANGVDYYKNPFSQSYKIIGDSSVSIYNGRADTSEYKNYLFTSAGAPGVYELILNYLLAQPGSKANVSATSFVHAGTPVAKTITVNGKTATVTLCAVYSDTLPQPGYVWMTNDMHFFALVNAWSSTIMQGYESWTDTLFALQEEADRNYYSAQVKNLSKDIQAHIFITHANLFQSSTATVQKNMTVEIVDGKIVSIHPSTKKEKRKKATIINAKGKFLMPGLWDMHGHYSKDEGAQYLAGGVTHIRDMGNAKILLTWKKDIQNNFLLGPDVSFMSGFIDKLDPYQGPTGKIVASLDEGLKAIEEYHSLGYGQIKIYSSIKPEWVAPMAAYAHALGMKVAGHVPAFMTATQAINDGYDEITHTNFVFLNFMGDTIDTRTPARFRVVGDRAGNIDLNSKEVKDFVALMKQKNISLDATLNIFQEMFDEFMGDTSASLKPVMDWMPEDWRKNIATTSPFGNEQQKPLYKASFANMLKMIKLLYDNGILLVAGTDGGEAIALHHELELYVQAGIPAADVLRIATYNAALDCRLQNEYGEIKEGRDADLILIDGNPAKNISDIRRVEWVMKNNKWYYPLQLLQSQGWKYFISVK